MTIFLYVVAAIVLLIVVLGIIAPNRYEVRRSIIVNHTLPETFQYLKSIKNQDNWSPWKKKDPNMTQTFEGTDGEIGFVTKWNGNKDVGEGEQVIISIIENESIDSELRFFKPWKSQSIGHFLVDDSGRNGPKDFQGEWIQFGSEKFPDWESVVSYLRDKSTI